MKKTISRKDAAVWVDGDIQEVFKTTETKDGILTGIDQAEEYIKENSGYYTNKTVEILVKYKTYSFEEVKAVVMKEV